MRQTNEQLLAVTKELIGIESIASNPKGLKEACDFMIRFLREQNKEITIEKFESGGRPSLLAYKGPRRPDRFHVILNGHLDVVPGKPSQFQATINNGKLYGRGVYDMKAACVLLADAFCEFVNKVPYKLGLQLVTDEESGGQNGTLYQIRQGVRSDFVICGECGRSTSAYEIANESKGAVTVDVGFKGKSAHGAYPWKGVSAVVKANNFINELLKQYPTPNQTTPQTTISIISLSAPSASYTTIADYAVLGLDIRYTSSDPNFKSIKDFTSFIKSIDPDVQIIELHATFKPLYSNPHHPLLLGLKEAAQHIENTEFSFVQRHGASDGRFYGALGDQACEFGIAGENQHGDEEYIPIDAFKNYRQTIGYFLATVAEQKVPQQALVGELAHTSTKPH